MFEWVWCAVCQLCAQIWNTGHHFCGLCYVFYNWLECVGFHQQTYTWPTRVHSPMHTDLLELQHTEWKIPALPIWNLIPEYLLLKHIQRKMGSRGGIKNRLQRSGSKLLLPVFNMSNVHSLQNKMDELCTLIEFDFDHWNSSIFCFTETRLSEDIRVKLDLHNTF